MEDDKVEPLTLSASAEEAMNLDDAEWDDRFGGSSDGFWYDITDGGYFDWRAAIDPKDHARIEAAIALLRELEQIYYDLTPEF